MPVTVLSVIRNRSRSLTLSGVQRLRVNKLQTYNTRMTLNGTLTLLNVKPFVKMASSDTLTLFNALIFAIYNVHQFKTNTQWSEAKMLPNMLSELDVTTQCYIRK